MNLFFDSITMLSNPPKFYKEHLKDLAFSVHLFCFDFIYLELALNMLVITKLSKIYYLLFNPFHSDGAALEAK